MSTTNVVSVPILVALSKQLARLCYLWRRTVFVIIFVHALTRRFVIKLTGKFLGNRRLFILEEMEGWIKTSYHSVRDSFLF